MHCPILLKFGGLVYYESICGVGLVIKAENDLLNGRLQVTMQR